MDDVIQYLGACLTADRAGRYYAAPKGLLVVADLLDELFPDRDLGERVRTVGSAEFTDEVLTSARLTTVSRYRRGLSVELSDDLHILLVPEHGVRARFRVMENGFSLIAAYGSAGGPGLIPMIERPEIWSAPLDRHWKTAGVLSEFVDIAKWHAACRILALQPLYVFARMNDLSRSPLRTA